MSLFNFQEIPIVLNRFFVKNLTESDRTIHEYSCSFEQNPENGEEQRAISSICYKLLVPAVRFGNKIITKYPVSSDCLKGDGWTVEFIAKKILDCANPIERKVIEQLERKILEKNLKRWNKTVIEKAPEGGFTWWIIGEDGTEKCGEGWEIHRGKRIDVTIDNSGNLSLEIDLHHRFYTPWTLHKWQDKYPEVAVNYVRNTYKDKNNKYITWKYEDVSEKTPEQLTLDSLGKTLADYHRQIGATEEEIQNSRVIFVKNTNKWNAQPVPHLSCRLSPCLTMEMLANLAEKSEIKIQKDIQGVFDYIKRSLDVRLKAEVLNVEKSPRKSSIIDSIKS